MTTTTIKSDADIQRAVLQELRWDPRVRDTEVGVQVKHGVVTLAGNIDSFAKKQAAREAAHRVPGVLDVANDLEVRVPVWWAKTDAEIAEAVRHALIWDAFVPDQRIKTTVSSGLVTLEGDVDHVFEREAAARVVGRLNGVCSVLNQLQVKSKAVDPAKVRASIEEALLRRAEREAKHLSIEVKDGVVVLSGTVRSWSEKNAVERVAGFAPGVRRIENKLVVDSYA